MSGCLRKNPHKFHAFLNSIWKFSIHQIPSLHLLLLLHQQGGCDFEYLKHRGAGRNPCSLKKTLPFHLWVNSTSRSTTMNLRKPEAHSDVLVTCSFGMRRHSVPLPSVAQWKSQGEYLTPSLSQLCFGESLGVLICFVIFMTPHWSKYGIPFSNDQILSNGPVQHFTLPTSWQGSSSQPKALSTEIIIIIII